MIAHARACNLEPLTQIRQINSVGFIQKLVWIQRRTNYVQELMVVKAFSNSIEISKAIDFMGKLSSLHAEYQTRG